jgi:hypothetical protein
VTLKQPRILWPSLRVAATTVPPLLVRPDESLLVLGHDRHWLLVQHRDGELGFLAPAYIAYLDEQLVGPPIGCTISGLWFSAGFGWAALNWIVLWQFFAQLAFLTLAGPSISASGILLAFSVAMWCGSRRLPERLFIVGSLLLSVLLLCESVSRS